MKKIKILIVEDDKDIAELIEYNLQKEGYSIEIINDGLKAISFIKKRNPDLIILDIMLPGADGLDVCKTVRNNEKTERIPIIMLSAKSQEADKIIGLELGADDYLTKPFSPRELIARIKAVLRRQQVNKKGDQVKVSGIIIDSLRHKVLISNKAISVTTTEFKLLKYLAQNQGMVMSRENILNEVFGYDSAVYDRTVDAHVKSLRKKLGKAKDNIETVRGIGYRFKD